MNDDWFEKGWAQTLEIISERSGLSVSTVKAVYSEFERFGLTDYDIEKDVIRSKIEEGELVG